MALALYRRYRPDTFEGVIGQNQVTIPLMRALDAGKLTHAYLFSGPRGCGKTSSARILARCINCVKGPTSHPCGECDSCRDLATGGPGSIDVVEIDAASHNGVDDARELRERAGFAPARDRYKIFILDEAHMVTQQGFNALLKIVEEPPEHVMFIFATTEPDKVIGTIRSRTHHYPFRLVPAEIMGPYLESICAKEGIKPEPGVLRLAMRAGGGSVRDTLSVLDQLMVGSVDGVISHDSAVALLGFTPETLIGEAVDAVIDHNGEALYGVIQKVVVGGFDPRRFVEDLLARVRDLLVLLLAGDRAESVMSDSAESEDMSDLRRQANALGLRTLTSLADTINNTLATMSGATSPRMRLELLAARLLAGEPDAGPSPSDGAPARPSGRSEAPSQSRPRSGGGFVGASRHAANAGTAAAPGSAGTSGTAGASGAVKSSGFIGSSRNAGQAVSRQESAGAAPEAPASVASAPPDASASPASPSSTGSAAAAAQSAGAQPAPDTRTPDQRWDALVAALPAEVGRYVGRDRVPRILFDPKGSQGKGTLWLKFDKALSKYAFALAVANEPVDGAHEVVAIVRGAVRKVFGPSVVIAPTKKLADNSEAAPYRSLSAAEQQRIKTQVLQADLRAAIASGAAKSGGLSSISAAGTANGSREHADAGASASSSDSSTGASASSDDGEPHHHKHVPVPDLSDDTDPWAIPQSGAGPSSSAPTGSTAPSASAASPVGTTPAGAPSAGAAPSAPTTAVAHQGVQTRQRPWPQTAAAMRGEAIVSSVVGSWGDVPPSDEQDDPWAASSPMSTAAATSPVQSTEQQRAGASWGGSAWPESAPGMHSERDAGPQWPAGPTSPEPNASTAPATAPVDPDDDEYSLNDASLSGGERMSIDDIKRLFEVKKVEQYAADDPLNPRNAKPDHHHDES
ncbi:DNA polymerase III subunit gamma/tau [Bifidobacterium jacchi]|uniref:DNA-directed DNA polymerase n=1 Tax=Bifidobacterium jacchi TaxID=2490545 RepID=A0A5N5RLJ5_9BIFI|nr:DNA polymerase III subunit gamma/tau [Bifidobacterium jacchi]KAB5608168.1 DNA polymerase III subunit gamma/tau [Bifidobacterium jacchi]